MTRPRDTQYAKFWKASKAVEQFNQSFKTEKGLEGFVRRAVARQFLARRYPLVREFTIEHLVGNQREKANSLMIGIPTGSRNLRTVIYCVSRLIWSRTQPQSAYTGWEWAAIYLDVVQALMGKPAALLLQSSYRAHNVRWREKKKVEVTPEILARLAAARQKRLDNI